VLAGFDDAEKVVDHLVSKGGDGDEKDRLLATLVAIVQQREHHELVSGLLWLGLWPGLTASTVAAFATSTVSPTS
jgi:hypothetical protein